MEKMLPWISKTQLALRNGQDREEVWVSYQGLVYDVSKSRLWRKGQHYEHWAGQDLTHELPDAPHTDRVFEKFKVIGQLETKPQSMILIADSGSSKTDWRMIDGQGAISQATTSGLNPYYQTSEEIKQIIDQDLIPQIDREVTEVHFYGAGCNGIKDEVVSSPLKHLFPKAEIAIQSDLLAAARALCGHEPGIACILGTGSNSCLYDGMVITEQTPTLGFWLGDEGSGAVMGRELVIAYLNGELPVPLAEKFKIRYKLEKEEVLMQAYEKAFPNRYFGQFSKFLFHHLKDPFVYQLVYKSFERFFERKVVKYVNYQQYKIHFVGSIAFYFSNVLRQVANDLGLTVKHVMESPIAGLTLYHQSS